MKLSDLEPRWAQNVMMNYHGTGQSNFPPVGFRNGLTFLCPHCVALGNREQRLGVTFTPSLGPMDWLTPGQPITDPKDNVWTRDGGDSFDSLSLSPSIDTSQGRIDFAGHWHGYIKNGEIL